jgi:hypothetical protein
MMVIDTETPVADAPPEYDDLEDLLDAVAPDYASSDLVTQDYFPEEYVVYYTGPRGSSKTIQLARHALKGLANGEKVFTNVELYPDKAGIKNQANPVGLEFLLSFDESLTDAIIVISEIDTWFDRMRETSTGNRLGGKFLQQLRKKGLRIFLDTQDYLPGVLMRQVDKLVYCHDFFFTQWGRDRSLPKGTTFYYDCYDYSGIFTGWRGYHWREALYHAERIWPLFNSYQIYDPLQFARKIKVVGGEMEYDMSSKELSSPGERRLKLQESQIREYSLILTKILREWESTKFMKGLLEHHAIIDDLPDRLTISTDAVKKYLSGLGGKARRIAEEQYNELRVHASAGHIAAFGPEQKFIELAKPIAEGNQND